jgi:hypothetical protein
LNWNIGGALTRRRYRVEICGLGVAKAGAGCYGGAVNAVETMPMDVPPGHEEWWGEFAAAARRPLPLRMRYAFIHTYKPVLDDARYRSFETLADYRAWCEANLADWLGYRREGAP